MAWFCRRFDGISSDEELIHQKSYRSLAVLNIVANQLWSFITFTGYHGAVIIIITVLFCLIKFHSSLDFQGNVLMISITAEVLVATVFCLNMAIGQAQASIAVCKSFLRQSYSVDKRDRLIWKSFRPTEISVGGFFTLCDSDFLLKFYSIVLESVVNLLLTLA